MIRVGLIGFGAWGRCHAQAISEIEETELVAISARSSQSCQKAESEFKVPCYQDYHQLVARSDIDFVDVVLPNYQHKEVAIKVLKCGHHLLLEKPMALSSEECDEILQARGERILYIGHEMRLSPLWGKVKELIKGGKIGKPVFTMIDLWRNAYRQGSQGWRFNKEKVGSWILEEPVHYFDLARWYMEDVGEPVSVYASASSCCKQKDFYDNLTAVINFAGHEYAAVSQTLGAFEHHLAAKIIGTEGAIVAEWEGVSDRTMYPRFKLRLFDGEQVRELPIEGKAGELFELRIQIRKMAETVSGKGIPPVTGEDGKWAVDLSTKAEESVRCGRLITIKEG